MIPFQELQRALDYRMRCGPTHMAETLDGARRNVRSRRVKHGIVVGKGNVVEELKIVLVVEGSPAAVCILHTDEPGKSTANRSAQAIWIGVFDAAQRHQDECRVIHVGVEVIAKLERPAARFGLAILHLPIAGSEDLIID